MKTFLFIFLAGYAVKCDDANYYVVQMPQEPAKEFKVYWNVPTMQCKTKKILFKDLYQKYGIIQNTGDSFRGDKISILYDPGAFPALLRNSSSGEIKYRNGGIPQEGDLIKHLDAFQRVLDQSIPDQNFSGVGIIDFESWRPILRQNFGVLTPYKDVSYEIEKKRHWWWEKSWLLEEAKRRFETSGRDFMEATIALAKKMRPRALWGYYGFPYCFNMAPNNRKESCADKVTGENDRTKWLWQESTALFPSVYSSEELTSGQLVALIRGRVKEAARVATRGIPILPYFWYRYRDDGYLRETDLEIALQTLYKSKASGFIIWGSSNDVNTVAKCKSLNKYVNEVLGPAVAKYTRPITRLGDDIDVNYNGDFKPSNATIYDPEYTWIPPVNYTQNIEKIVETELKEEEQAANADKDLKNSVLIDIILHSIANYCLGGCDIKNVDSKQGEDDEFSVTEAPVPLVTKDPFAKAPSEPTTIKTTTISNIDYLDLNANTGTTVSDFNETSDYADSTTSAYDIILNIIEDTSTTTTEISSISTTEAFEFDNSTDDGYASLQDEITILSNISFIVNGHNIDESATENVDMGISTTENVETNINTTENVDIISSTTENVDLSNTIDITGSNEFSTTDFSVKRKFNEEVTESSTTEIISTKFPTIPTTVSIEVTSNPSTVEFTSFGEEEERTVVNESTIAPILKEQVLGSVSRGITSARITCSLFYVYSITKCLCTVFGYC